MKCLEDQPLVNIIGDNSPIGMQESVRLHRTAQMSTTTRVDAQPEWSNAQRLMETFRADIRRFVLQNIWGSAAVRPALETMDAIELLAVYGNWRVRLIDPQPRTVHASPEFLASRWRHDPEHAYGVASLVDKIERGEDLQPHLSERVREGFSPRDPTKPKKLSARRDLDMLLNDWGVHHLHLSSQPGNGGFNQRTEMVLMAVFRPTDAYLIDIMDHKQWANEEIARIMVEAWPDAELLRPLNGILPGRKPLTKEERKRLRDAGGGAVVTIGGRGYFGVGYSTSGTNLHATMEAALVGRRLKWFAGMIETDPAYVARTLLQHGATAPEVPDLHFEVIPQGWGVFETKTRTFFDLRNMG